MCSHLADEGPYKTVCESLVVKYPNLVHKDFKHAKAPLRANPTFRIVTIDFRLDGIRADPVNNTLHSVLEFLESSSINVSSRRLYLLEGQNPALFSILGNKLRINPRVFMRHQRTALCDCEHQGGNTPFLASLIGYDASYVIDFFDFRLFPSGFRSQSLKCFDSHRHISLPNNDGRFEEIGIVCNKATIWGHSE